jgi:molecular chaperone GrpE
VEDMVHGETCQTQLDQCQENLQQLKDQYLRLNADFDNYRKRVDKERTQWVASAQTVVLADMLPIVEDFERALKEFESREVPAELAVYKAGLELIAKSLHKLLKKYDIEEISDLAVFNPELHEAVMQVPADDKYPSGTIVTVFEKGYKHKGQVLRPAKVSVAQ